MTMTADGNVFSNGFAIAPNDDMFAGNLPHYERVGETAIRCINEVLRLSGNPKINSVLDLPSGFGRVGRRLRTRFPDAALYVSDVNAAAAEFSAKTLQATLLPPTPEFVGVDFGLRFDLIWVGSLITHLTETDTNSFLDFVIRHLSRNGIAVVSSAGTFSRQLCEEAVEKHEGFYGLSFEATGGVLQQLTATGFGYDHDPATPRYGISLIAPSWLKDAVARAGGKTVYYGDRAYDLHQDVIAFTKQNWISRYVRPWFRRSC